MTAERRIKLDQLRAKLSPATLAAGIDSFTRMRQLFASLEDFCLKLGAASRGGGFLATMIKITARAAESKYPLEPNDFKTPGGARSGRPRTAA
jgi:hypothetical protein